MPQSARRRARRRSRRQAIARRSASLSPQLERKRARFQVRPAGAARPHEEPASGSSARRAPTAAWRPSANRSSAASASGGAGAGRAVFGRGRAHWSSPFPFASFSPQRGISLLGSPSWSSTRPTTVSNNESSVSRFRIKRRRGRQDDRAGARHRQHVLEVDRRQRRLAHDQHQLAPLLHHHVGGAPDQIVRDAVGDARQAAGRAGDHHHRVPARRARGERRAEVAQAVLLERVGGHVADLVVPDLVARLREHQADLDGRRRAAPARRAAASRRPTPTRRRSRPPASRRHHHRRDARREQRLGLDRRRSRPRSAAPRARRGERKRPIDSGR